MLTTPPTSLLLIHATLFTRRVLRVPVFTAPHSKNVHFYHGLVSRRRSIVIPQLTLCFVYPTAPKMFEKVRTFKHVQHLHANKSLTDFCSPSRRDYTSQLDRSAISRYSGTQIQLGAPRFVLGTPRIASTHFFIFVQQLHVKYTKEKRRSAYVQEKRSRKHLLPLSTRQ